MPRQQKNSFWKFWKVVENFSTEFFSTIYVENFAEIFSKQSSFVNEISWSVCQRNYFFQNSVIFAGKAKAYPTGIHFVLISWSETQILDLAETNCREKHSSLFLLRRRWGRMCIYY